MENDEIQKLKEALQEILECTEGFYNENTNPARLYPELTKYAGYINVIRETCMDALKK